MRTSTCYHSVFLQIAIKLKAQLTPLPGAGGYSSLYFSESGQDGGFILDLDYSLQCDTNEERELEVISDSVKYRGVVILGFRPIH